MTKYSSVYEKLTSPKWNDLINGRFVSLNHNIYIVARWIPSPVDVDHAAHAGGPTMCDQNVPPTLTKLKFFHKLFFAFSYISMKPA